jgi:hypothetical protein
VDRFFVAQPRLLLVVTATYTGNPPSNAAKAKAWLGSNQVPSIPWCDLIYVFLG